MVSFEEQMRMKPSFMFSSATERDPTDPNIEEAPGPQDYEN